MEFPTLEQTTQPVDVQSDGVPVDVSTSTASSDAGNRVAYSVLRDNLRMAGATTSAAVGGVGLVLAAVGSIDLTNSPMVAAALGGAFVGGVNGIVRDYRTQREFRAVRLARAQ